MNGLGRGAVFAAAAGAAAAGAGAGGAAAVPGGIGPVAAADSAAASATRVVRATPRGRTMAMPVFKVARPETQRIFATSFALARRTPWA